MCLRTTHSSDSVAAAAVAVAVEVAENRVSGMDESVERPLSGGFSNEVVQVGRTVRDPRSLWRVQLALECKVFTEDTGRLVETPCDDPDGLDTCYLASYPGGGSELALAADAPSWFVDRVRELSIAEVFRDPSTAAGHLTSIGGQPVVAGHFHTYCFDPDIASEPTETIRQEGPEQFAIVLDGQPVAGSSSSRSDEHSAELWIETEPKYRRRGFATVLARRWARDVQDAGKIAFYSHLHDNHASTALAQNLSVRPLFELVSFNLGQQVASR